MKQNLITNVGLLLGLSVSLAMAGCAEKDDFLGFRLGQELDVQDEFIRDDYYLGKPESRSFASGYHYMKCRVRAKDKLFGKMYVSVSSENKVVAIEGENSYQNLADATLAADKVWNELRESYGNKWIDCPDTPFMKHCAEIKDSGKGFLELLDTESLSLQVICLSAEFASMVALESESIAKRNNELAKKKAQIKKEDTIEAIQDAVEDALHQMETECIKSCSKERLPSSEVMDVLDDGFSAIAAKGSALRNEMMRIREIVSRAQRKIRSECQQMNAFYRECLDSIGKTMQVDQAKMKIDEAKEGLKSTCEIQKRDVRKKMEQILRKE